MLYGIGLSGTGAQIERARMENVSNNLANVETVGFKQDLLTVMMRPMESRTWFAPEHDDRPLYAHDLLDRIGGGIWLHKTQTLHQQGPTDVTGNPFDFLIDGKGFFTVQDAETGETHYTRAGNFHINSEGWLMTAEGEGYVLNSSGQRMNMRELIGQNGEGMVQVNGDGGITISMPNGSVVPGEELGVVSFSDADLEKLRKLGRNRFGAPDDVASRAVRLSELDGAERAQIGMVKQGMLEGSASDPVTLMKEMIDVNRAFERNMNMIALQNGTLERLISRVASI